MLSLQPGGSGIRDCVDESERINEKKVITISPDDRIDQAFFRFHYDGIRHLPVVTDKVTVVGIISDRDIKQVLGPDIENTGARMAPC